GFWKGVVGGGGKPAHGTVAFQSVKTGRSRLFDELVLKLFAGKTERDVHQAAAVFFGVAAVIAIRRINRVVENPGLLYVERMHLLKPADVVERPFEAKPA